MPEASLSACDPITLPIEHLAVYTSSRLADRHFIETCSTQYYTTAERKRSFTTITIKPHMLQDIKGLTQVSRLNM